MSDSGGCSLAGHDCDRRMLHMEESLTSLEAQVRDVESSVGMLLGQRAQDVEEKDTDRKGLQMLRNKIDALEAQVAAVARLEPLVIGADKGIQRVEHSLGEVREVMEHILERMGNGRGGE